MSKPVKSLNVLKYELKLAQEHYDRVKAYHTAVALQTAERALAAYYTQEREAWVILQGGKDEQETVQTA